LIVNHSKIKLISAWLASGLKIGWLIAAVEVNFYAAMISARYISTDFTFED